VPQHASFLFHQRLNKNRFGGAVIWLHRLPVLFPKIGTIYIPKSPFFTTTHILVRLNTQNC